VTTNYTYDNLSRLQSVLHQLSGSTIDGASYGLDSAGNRTSKTNYYAGVTSNYTYDLIYELTGVTQGTNTTESYTYDPVGNRLSSMGVSPYTVNVSNELSSTPNATYTYDNNGNTLTKVVGSNTTRYTWDFENRLSSVTLPGSGGTVTFKYDPFGRRIYKSSSSGTSVYAYDGDNLVEETNATGGVVTRYSQGRNIDEPLAMLRSAATSYYHADGLGSVTSLSNAAGALAQTYTFDSFGNQTATSGSLTNPIQYTAREWDTETSLYYYRARYYDPTAGKFLSEDPIRFRGGGANFYGYAMQNPVLLIDPSGERYCKFDNCFKIFQKAIKNFSRKDFDAKANATPVLDPRSPALAPFSQDFFVGGSNTTPISQSLPYGAGGITINGPRGSVILLGPNAYVPSNDPDATYLHELIHAYTHLDDDQVFDLFKPYGLRHLNPGSYDITVWIMSNCKNTVSSQ
jgi:RHS repeat-associated protein